MRIRIRLYEIIDMYRNLTAPVKASLWFTICNFLQQGIAMLTVPVFTRLLNPSQFGTYTVFQSWYSILSIFATLNLSAGVFNNGMIKFEKDKEGYTCALQGLSTFVTLLLFIVYLVNIDFWNAKLGLSTLYVIVMFLQFLFLPAFLFWSAGQRFEYKYKRLIVATIILALGSPTLGVIAVLSTSYKAEARILSYVFIHIAIGMVFYIYNCWKGRLLFDKYYWKFALSFNIPLIPHYLALSVLGQIGRIMIAHMVGEDKAAIYSVASNISLIISLVTQAINNSFIPYTYKALKDKRYEEIGKNTDRLLILMGATAVLAMAFGPEVLRIFASKDYYEAIWIIPPAVAGTFFSFLYPLFGNVEFYFEENKFIMMASVSGAAVNILLNRIAIPLYGYMAAGYTTLICYILFSISHYIFHRIVLHKHAAGARVYSTGNIIGISAVVLSVMFFMLVVYRYTMIRYGMIGIIACVALIKRNYFLNLIREREVKRYQYRINMYKSEEL